MNWSIRKPWYRILSVMMSLALTITLLSGCGASTPTQTVTNVQAEKQELVHICEQVEDTIRQLECDLSGNSDKNPEDTVAKLEELLAETEEKTDRWLEEQEKMAEGLSESTAKVLGERNAEFTNQLAVNQKQAEILLSDIASALKKGNTEEANRLTNELDAMLIQQQEPKTYGENLPGEVKVQEAEVAELENGETATSETTPVTLSEKALSELSVTEEDTALDDELKAKAEELGTPLAIYNYVKNNIGYEYYYGSRKGAVGTYAAFGGNDMDQASLMIAMLRHLGVEAQYVRGTIYLEEEPAVALTGADTIAHAADVLAAAGTPVTKLTKDGEVVKLSMEHVWVRAYVPYTDYRGAGNVSGDKIWIDLDTGIKACEEVENLYDVMDEEGFREEVETVVNTGDTAALNTMMDSWESKLSSMNLENVYARKRMIRQEELSYLPLSLQYEVAEETETFAQPDNTDKDSISFSVGGESLGTYTSSELSGKDILLSFRPVGSADEEILNSYDSIFDVPAHAVFLKPVLLIDGEVAAAGDNTGTTLGTSQSFTMNIRSGDRNTMAENTVTTGSMYAVTLDNQSITGSELERVYNEATALKDSVTEDNVYSEEYLGKILSLAGKMYFAQIDIADMMAAEIYGVSQTRSLSEGITGYEIQTSSLYGVVTGITEGNLYIDIDTDARSVVSLTGDRDASREYMLATGMLSSAYESIVWEEITGYESVSTMSLLAKAQEENVEILTLSNSNLETEIQKLNTDETTEQTIINAVNSGKIVIVSAEEVTMEEWHGIGYMIVNPETGVAAYMITGGLNGGSSPVAVTSAFLVDTVCSVVDLAQAITTMSAAIKAMACTVTLAGGIAGALIVAVSMACMLMTLNNMMSTFIMMFDYLNGNLDAGEDLIDSATWNFVLSVGINAGGIAAKKTLQNILKSDLIEIIGADCTERLMREFSDVKELSKYVKQILKMDISSGVIIEISEKFGKSGLDWIIGRKSVGLTDDLIRKILKADSLDNFTDDVVKAIKNSDGYADDMVEFVNRYGKGAGDAIAKYGDEAVEVIKDYKDEAVEGFKDGKTPDEVRTDIENADAGGNETGGSGSDLDTEVKIQEYIENIVDSSGNVDATKMRNLRLAIQKGTFTKQEISLLSKKISEIGITEAFETEMKNIDFGTYLRNIKGEPPTNMINPHAHHILFKTGNGEAQQQLVKEGQEILRKYGIDPIVGEENLVWAPNGITGQHDITALQQVVDALKEVDEAGGDYEDIVKVLKNMGQIASNR